MTNGADSSVSVQSPEGEVLVCFQNRYSKLESEAPIEALAGGDVILEKYFRQSFNLNVNGEELPAGKEQEIVDDKWKPDALLDWLGLKMRDASVVRGIGVLPMFAGLLGLLLLVGALAAMWAREGR